MSHHVNPTACDVDLSHTLCPIYPSSTPSVTPMYQTTFIFFLMIPHYHTHTIVLLLGEIRYVTPPRQTNLFPMLDTTSSATAAVPKSHCSRVCFRCISLYLPVRINHGLRCLTSQQQQQKHITLFPDQT